MGETSQSSGSGPVRRIGVLGGTFDPIHNGHLAVGRFVMAALGLDEVVFVPAGRPWMRDRRPETSPVERLEMVRLAVEGQEGFSCSDVDVRRPGPTYTVDTLRDLQAGYCRAARLYLIVGADTAYGMHLWRYASRLSSRCSVVVVGRPGMFPLSGLPEGHPARGAIFLEGPMNEVSGSGIRDTLLRGELPVGQVPVAAARYMASRGLYGLVGGSRAGEEPGPRCGV